MNSIVYEYGASLGFQTTIVHYHLTSLRHMAVVALPTRCFALHGQFCERQRLTRYGPVIHMRLGPSVPFESYGRWWQS